MNTLELLKRAEDLFSEDHSYIRREVLAAEKTLAAAVATPARKQAERELRRVIRRLENELPAFEAAKQAWMSQCASAEAALAANPRPRYNPKTYDAEREAAAWSRGADYQTEMRMRDRIRMIYGQD